MILTILFAAGALLADTTPAGTAAATVAPPAATGSATPGKTAAAAKPKLICRTESVTGSLMPKKTCYSPDDFAQRQQEERDNLRRIQNNRGFQPNL
jgi:hypothetical protein